MGWLLLKLVEIKTKAKRMEQVKKFLEAEDFEFIRNSICSMKDNVGCLFYYLIKS